MSDYTKKEVELFGKKRFFRALTGVVVKVDQRSDTHVYGSGSSGTYGGYGAGNVSIGSYVSVTTNFWIRSASGQEFNYQFGMNIPLLEGHVVHIVDIVDECSSSYWNEKLKKMEVVGEDDIPVSDGPVFLYNNSTDLYYQVTDWRRYGPFMKVINASDKIFPTAAVLGLVGAIFGLLYDRQIGLGLGVIGSIFGGFVGYIWLGLMQSARKDKVTEYFRPFCIELNKVAERFSVSGINDHAKIIEHVETIDAPPQSAIGKPSFCTECGTAVATNASFCAGCGTKLIGVGA
jgi:hypothetical protein